MLFLNHSHFLNSKFYMLWSTTVNIYLPLSVFDLLMFVACIDAMTMCHFPKQEVETQSSVISAFLLKLTWNWQYYLPHMYIHMFSFPCFLTGFTWWAVIYAPVGVHARVRPQWLPLPPVPTQWADYRGLPVTILYCRHHCRHLFTPSAVQHSTHRQSPPS